VFTDVCHSLQYLSQLLTTVADIPSRSALQSTWNTKQSLQGSTITDSTALSAFV